MDTFQTMDAASMIASEFWHLKLEEIILAFKRGKLGKYGKAYNRLDVQVLCEWLTQYNHSEEKAAYLEQVRSLYRQKERDTFNQGASAEVVEKLESMLSKKDILKPKPVNQAPTDEEDLFDLTEAATQMTDDELAYVRERYYLRGWVEGLKVIDYEIANRATDNPLKQAQEDENLQA